TRIEVVTEGILTRRLQSDPELKGVGLVIFDEFHERSLQADLSLALALDVRTGLREDLRLLVMSATLDTKTLAAHLENAPVIVGEGRSYPVSVHYLERPPQGGLVDTAVKGVHRALAETSGDLLLFLPGSGEIRRVADRLGQALSDRVALLPLYGDLKRDEQDHALMPQPGRRRVVLATSIAETSLTIEGISTVVDSGWSRRPCFDPNSGLSRLRTVRVSRAAAEQRTGRAGRLGPGHCYRLWSAAEDARLLPGHPPELLEADLAPLALELALWGVSEPDRLHWLDEPPRGAYAQARALLQRLDAIDRQGRITPIGRDMASLSLHPRLAYMLLNAGERRSLATDLAGLLSERDILKRGIGQEPGSDMELRLQALAHWRRGGERGVNREADMAICSRVERAARGWRKLRPGRRQGPDVATTGGLLALAFPDRVAQRRPGSDDRYLLASGRGVRLPEGDPLIRHDYLVVADLDAGQREGRVYRAAGIGLEEIRQLQAAHIEYRQRTDWDAASASVVACEEERFGSIVLDSRPLKQPNEEAMIAGMIRGIRQLGLGALPWTRELQQWRQRVESLRFWQPEAGWPDLSDQALLDALEQWLGPYLPGVTRRDHLKSLDLGSILRSRLAWSQQQDLERLAPVHLSLPSGTRKRISYRPGEAPLLEVRLQELFGLRQTPAICGGQVPLLLHLLSPAQRPIQVTSDLSSFWDNTYAEVRKELKGRYPKHYWPDDPATAIPTSRVRPSKGD
ncbi:MAG: ATP-dependent helicase HrpB, partial [Sedimenticola sp.]|nr:ATP-dependent helicase HrpB [Sedimenticola sp.]